MSSEPFTVTEGQAYAAGAANLDDGELTMDESEEGSALADGAHVLSELERLKGEIDTYDNVIKSRVTDCETLLEGLRLGVPISVKVAHNETTEEFTSLALQKVKDRWRLVVRTEDVGDADSVEIVPLNDTDRETRVSMCIEFLPKLLASGVGTLEWRLKQRKLAIKTMDEWLQHMTALLSTRASQKPTKPNPMPSPLRPGKVANERINSLWARVCMELKDRLALAAALDHAVIEEWQPGRVVLAFPENLLLEQTEKNRRLVEDALSSVLGGPTTLLLKHRPPKSLGDK